MIKFLLWLIASFLLSIPVLPQTQTNRSPASPPQASPSTSSKSNPNAQASASQTAELPCPAWLCSLPIPEPKAPAVQTSPPSLPAAAQDAEQKGLIAAKQQEFVLAARYFEEARKQAPYSGDVLFNLGLAESKLPGRELRAIVWFKAYLASSPAAANASEVKEQITEMEIKAEANAGKMVEAARKVAYKFADENDKESALGQVAIAYAQTGDMSGEHQLAT